MILQLLQCNAQINTFFPQGLPLYIFISPGGDSGDGGDGGSFDANDDRKGFPHQVLEKFGVGCANMNIGTSK